jgi:hypothetical protein
MVRALWLVTVTNFAVFQPLLVGLRRDQGLTVRVLGVLSGIFLGVGGVVTVEFRHLAWMFASSIHHAPYKEHTKNVLEDCIEKSSRCVILCCHLTQIFLPKSRHPIGKTISRNQTEPIQRKSPTTGEPLMRQLIVFVSHIPGLTIFNFLKNFETKFASSLKSKVDQRFVLQIYKTMSGGSVKLIAVGGCGYLVYTLLG